MASDLPPLLGPAERALTDAGIGSLARLSKFTEAQIAQLRGVGPTAIDKLRSALRAEGRAFKAEPRRSTRAAVPVHPEPVEGRGSRRAREREPSGGVRAVNSGSRTARERRTAAAATTGQAARFFKSPAEFRRWLARNGERETELWVGIYRKASGKQGITYEDAVRQALCYGWIDGVRRSAGADGSAQRFTPRTAQSTWSALNLKRYAEMDALGLIAEPGRRAHERRNPAADGYAIADRQGTKLGDEYERRFAEHAQAWEYYQAQPPWYRRETAYWIMSAKREETRERRFAALLADSAAGRRIDALNPRRYEPKPAPKRGAA